MKSYAQVLFLAIPLAIVPAAFAQHETFTINPDTSQVTFTLGGSGHHVQGTFHLQGGSISFDPSAQKISGSVIVSAGSGNSGEPSRDKKMNTDVLDTGHFAEVTFAPSSYQGTIATSGDSTVQVSGIFTLHGTPHDLTVPMQVHIDGANLTAKSHFTVPYVKWGLKDPSIFILKVAKEVDIDLTLSGSLTRGS
jgi:polyisoprenoid-binding protein YceI